MPAQPSRITRSCGYGSRLALRLAGTTRMELRTMIPDSIFKQPARHCEPPGRREAPPDDRLHEAIQSRLRSPGLPRPSHLAAYVRDDREAPLLWVRDGRENRFDLPDNAIARTCDRLA